MSAAIGSLAGRTLPAGGGSAEPSPTHGARPSNWPRSSSFALDASSMDSNRSRPTTGGGTVQELLCWWLQNYSARLAAHASNEISVRVHLFDADLARLTLRSLRPVEVKAFMDAKSQEGLSARSVNHLRGFLSRAFNAAIATGRWPGRNPVAQVPALRVSGRQARRLPPGGRSPQGVDVTPPRWRPLFATALYTAMRKGELLALQREDVDLNARAILVRGSWERETTKGGHIDAIPVADDVVPWMKAALAVSESALVFPGPGGTMFRRDVDLEGFSAARSAGRASSGAGAMSAVGEGAATSRSARNRPSGVA